MAGNAPTPITASIPTTPTPTPTPSAPAPVAAPVQQPTPTLTAPEAAPTPPTPAPTKTLQEILQERKARFEVPAPQPAQPQAPPTETPTPTPETPQPQTPDLVAQAAKDQLFELMQKDPGKLMQLLQAQQGAPEPTPENAAPQMIAPDAYRQQLSQEAQQWMGARPAITAAGLFGEENAQEMGLQHADFTQDLEKFVVATVGPLLAGLMGDVYSIQHKFTNEIDGFKPILESHQWTGTQQELGKQLVEVFPALQSDQKAAQFAEKRFAELAPMFMDKALLDKPSTNPKEYARISVAIAKIAAGEFSSQTPANLPVPTIATPPAGMTPEPQPVQSTYRNHLGQFSGQKVPLTLDQFNAQKLTNLDLGNGTAHV